MEIISLKKSQKNNKKVDTFPSTKRETIKTLLSRGVMSFFCTYKEALQYESDRYMNLDRYIKQLVISLSEKSQYYNISISTFEKYNEEYKCITRSIMLKYTEPHPDKENYCIEHKEWIKNKQELLLRLKDLWEKRNLNVPRKQTKNKKK